MYAFPDGQSFTIHSLRPGRRPLRFIMVGVYWIAHHHVLHFITQVKRRLLWLNLLLLLSVVFSPLCRNGGYCTTPEIVRRISWRSCYGHQLPTVRTEFVQKLFQCKCLAYKRYIWFFTQPRI